MSPKKTGLIYFLVSVSLYLFQKIYHYFGHGVTSNALKSIFLIPLIGILMLILLYPLLSTFRNRLGMNLYNSGIGMLVAGGILHGILEIAGSDSPYIEYYYGIGSGFLLVALGSFVLFKIKKQQQFKGQFRNQN